MKWSESLIKSKIDPQLFEIEDDIKNEEHQILKDFQFYCEGIFDTPERIKRVKGKIKDLKKNSKSKIIKAIGNEILGELKEISDDLKFANSRRGKFVLFANDYGQEVYKELRTHNELNDFMIMSHPEKELLVLTVVGSTPSAKTVIKAINIIDKYPAGVPFQINITLNHKK